MQHKFKLLTLLLLLVLVWFAWPVYQFFAHKNDAPMLPFGIVAIPENDPVNQTVMDARYKNAGEKALNALVDHKKAILVPGISAAVAINGSLVWTGTAGWADIKKNRPITADTRFRIGSTSKALTGTVMARMVQSGAIVLDSPIENYLADLPNSQWQGITPRQLASHMAGLPEYKKNKDKGGIYHTMALRRHYVSVIDSLEVFDETPLLFRPGTQFHYSTFHTILLSAVMVAVSEQPYLTLVEREVLGPLKMIHTSADPVTPTDSMATFYWRRGKQVKPWRRVDLSHRLAGGGFISTPTDMVKLGSAWLDEDFIALEIRKAFWAPQRLSSGDVNEQNYALGWRIAGGDDYIALNANHGGVSRGSQSWLMVIPENRMSVAVMINSNTEEFWDFGKIAVTLIELFMVENTVLPYSSTNPPAPS